MILVQVFLERNQKIIFQWKGMIQDKPLVYFWWFLFPRKKVVGGLYTLLWLFVTTHCVETTPIKKVAKSLFNVFGKSWSKWVSDLCQLEVRHSFVISGDKGTLHHIFWVSTWTKKLVLTAANKPNKLFHQKKKKQ